MDRLLRRRCSLVFWEVAGSAGFLSRSDVRRVLGTAEMFFPGLSCACTCVLVFMSVGSHERTDPKQMLTAEPRMPNP